MSKASEREIVLNNPEHILKLAGYRPHPWGKGWLLWDPNRKGQRFHAYTSKSKLGLVKIHLDRIPKGMDRHTAQPLYGITTRLLAQELIRLSKINLLPRHCDTCQKIISKLGIIGLD